MTFDSIIFDVDGTLWDSTDVVAAAYNKTFEKEGISLRVTGDELKKLFGKPMDEIFAMLLPQLDAAEQNRLAEAAMKQEDEELEHTPGTFYPQVRETLRKLSAKYRLYIVSNCQCGYIELLIRHAGIQDFISGHLCFGETKTTKGQTILTLMAAQNLKAPVYVGDIQGDANACKEAGIPIIHAAYGFGSIEAPYARISCLPELAELLL